MDKIVLIFKNLFRQLAQEVRSIWSEKIRFHTFSEKEVAFAVAVVEIVQFCSSWFWLACHLKLLQIKK